MAAEIPIEMLHVKPKLREFFTGILPEADFNNTEEQKEANFLSRALAAYAVHKLAGCSLPEAAASVIDGGGDGGIDAFYFSPATQILWVVQSKFISNGRSEPELKEVNTFQVGLNFLLKGDFQAFTSNKAWQRLIPDLEHIFKQVSQVRPVLVYSGIKRISEDRLLVLESLESEFNSGGDDYVEVQTCNLTTIHDWLLDADLEMGVPDVDLTILNPSLVQEPYETILGLIPLRDIFELYRQYGKALVEANIRYYKGQTEVNKEICQTIENEPEVFFYLNNGITAYCKEFKVFNLDRKNDQRKRVTVLGLSIVNGAQTLGSIEEYFKEAPDAQPGGSVFIKVISLEKSEDERQFADRITRSTNFQNKIGSRDFVALDEQQERIASQLKLSNIIYHYKDGVGIPVPDEENFLLQEATTALACLAKSSDSHDFCARIVTDVCSLWSMDEIYPSEPLLKSRYSRVFRSDRSARTVWRAVQVQRLVVKAMQTLEQGESGLRQVFFEYSRWIILNVIFIQLKLEQGNDLSLTSDEIDTILQSTIDFAEALWNTCRSEGYLTDQVLADGTVELQASHDLESVFGDPLHCQKLRAALLKALNQLPVLLSSNQQSEVAV